MLPLLLVMGLATSCGGAAPTTPLSSGTDVVMVEEAVTPDVVAGTICIDGTGSVPEPVRTEAVELLAEQVETWVPALDFASGGTPAVPGLDLLVRKVLGGSSLASNALVHHVELEPIPSVLARPQGPEGNYSELLATFRTQAQRATEAATRARDSARVAAATIREADWSAESSEIAGCLEANVRGLPGARHVLISDLQQVDPPQVGVADFTDAEMLIVLSCDTATACGASESWRHALLSRQAHEPQFIAPEQMGRRVPDFLFSKDTAR